MPALRVIVNARAVPCLLLCATLPAGLRAMQDEKEGAARPRPIQDNSFLVEEAYNQEARVVQHISGMMYQPASRDWSYSFTQEWPVTSQKHQLSYTVPVARVEDGTGARRIGLGDAMLNYRYQLAGDGESRVAVAPRLSLVMPTGDRDAGLGRGRAGIQANLPVSATLGERFVSHVNAGFTLTPRVAGVDGSGAATVRDAAAGGSIIWLAHPRFNVMTEAIWSRTGVVAGGRAAYAESVLLAPGVRGALNFASGLQIVPGFAIPFELRGERTRSVFSYLSFEHPF